MYISIHLNYLNDFKYRGPQVFYNNDNKKLANIIQNNMNKELSSNREVKKIPNDTYMYEKLNIPGVLIECGFLSNKEDRYLLKTNEYQKKIAKIIAKGILEYY